MYDYNEEHALEITVCDHKVAWTEDDDVYVHQPDHPECKREDGYVLIGTLEWEDGHTETYDEGMQYNIDRLRAFAKEHLK